jgi:hypothetical protein
MINKVYLYIYSFLYRPAQNLIEFFLKKNSFIKDLTFYINNSYYDEIYDIGCCDGIIADYLNLRQTKYFGYDIDFVNIKKAKIKFKNNKNVKFYHQTIDNLKVKKRNCKRCFLFIGVFHHLNDDQIKYFLKKISYKDHVIAIDPFFHVNQSIIGILMKKLDQGKYIRHFNSYQNLLKKFIFKKKIYYYLRFYSHLVSFRNINQFLINKYF